MEKPVISILMPVKNAASFLKEALNSINEQSFTSWELIAINDHSSDMSLEILNEFEKNNNKTTILENNGNGIIDALKNGLNISRGIYITRMDADDIMDKNKLKYLYDALKIKGNGWVSTGLVKYFASDKSLNDGYIKYEKWLNNLTSKNTNFNDIYKECVIPSPCWMMLKSDLIKIGGFDSFIYPEDYDLAFRMYSSKIKAIGVNKILHFWRDYPDRSSRNDPNYLNNTFAAIKIKYFIANDYNPSKTLILWGAGKKGKLIAKALIDYKTCFEWVTDNPKKIGKNIYGKKIINSEIFKTINDYQVIIAISSKDFNPFLNIKNSDCIFYFC